MDPVAPVIVATYAEIALKGKNRSVFLRRLLNNMRTMLKDEPIADIQHVESRILVRLDDPARTDAVVEILGRVFGLQWISPAVSVPREAIDDELNDDLAAGREPRLTAVSAQACELATAARAEVRNFKVGTRRSDRTFPLISPDISRIVGGAVHEMTGLPGLMQNPDLLVNVLILKKDVLVFTAKETVCGGLPAGISGRVMVLLSGGIDSPVAAWLMMRRGARPEFIHFYAGRSFAEADADKIIDLVRILRRYSPGPLTLWLAPVVPYELRAIGNVTDNYDMLMFRRFMVKTAARQARRQSCKALITGDSLGQVASQTLANLGAISPDIEIPILRPLVGMDKMEITARSRKVGLFDTSILPYRDCCSIRSPRPVLRARARDLLLYSQQMKLDEAVDETLTGLEKLVVD
ncbi:tRNA 4-thiouridine(8) synthase ThiI [bacterium]|nr:MAG: tRNA 4-thiouridine(8) synthase ThiI [bacterium]